MSKTRDEKALEALAGFLNGNREEEVVEKVRFFVIVDDTGKKQLSDIENLPVYEATGLCCKCAGCEYQFRGDETAYEAGTNVYCCNCVSVHTLDEAAAALEALEKIRLIAGV